MQKWLERHSGQGAIPDDLFKRAEKHLLSERVMLPGASVLERMVVGVCLTAHDQIFEEIYRHLSSAVLQSIDNLLIAATGELKKLPHEAPLIFVPKELRRALKDSSGNINRNVWELGLALAIKDVLMSGDLYLSQSRQHVSFWNLILDEGYWRETREASFAELNQPQTRDARELLVQQFNKAATEAGRKFGSNDFGRKDLCIIPASRLLASSRSLFMFFLSHRAAA